jgi:hypothetical protein
VGRPGRCHGRSEASGTTLVEDLDASHRDSHLSKKPVAASSIQRQRPSEAPNKCSPRLSCAVAASSQLDSARESSRSKDAFAAPP